MSRQLDEAREHVEVANSIGTSPWGTEHSLNLALVKATIELAEQQRIANLQTERTYLQNELKGDYNNHPKLLRLMKVDGQIQNGLGLREPEL